MANCVSRTAWSEENQGDCYWFFPAARVELLLPKGPEVQVNESAQLQLLRVDTPRPRGVFRRWVFL